MPKVTGPLFSVEAHKQLAKGIVFQGRPGGTAVYGYKQPKVSLTWHQLWQRWLIRNAVAYWQALSDDDKAVWDSKAKGRGQSGYSLFMHEHTKVTPDVVLAPDFTVGQGSILPDLSDYWSHGAITGASWADGLHGKCLDFNPATPSYVEIPASYTQLNFTSEDFSVVIRCKFLIDATWRVLFGRGLWGTDGYSLETHSSYPLSFKTYQPITEQATSCNAGTLVSDTWYTLGVSRSGASARIYAGGVDIVDNAAEHVDPVSCSRSAKIGIGDNLTDGPFDGKIEFLRVFGGKALSAAEHLAWHNALK